MWAANKGLLEVLVYIKLTMKSNPEARQGDLSYYFIYMTTLPIE